jgi:hypothetical protein
VVTYRFGESFRRAEQRRKGHHALYEREESRHAHGMNKDTKRWLEHLPIITSSATNQNREAVITGQPRHCEAAQRGIGEELIVCADRCSRVSE